MPGVLLILILHSLLLLPVDYPNAALLRALLKVLGTLATTPLF